MAALLLRSSASNPIRIDSLNTIILWYFRAEKITGSADALSGLIHGIHSFTSRMNRFHVEVWRLSF